MNDNKKPQEALMDLPNTIIELDKKNTQITNLKKNIDEFNMIINKSTT